MGAIWWWLTSVVAYLSWCIWREKRSSKIKGADSLSKIISFFSSTLGALPFVLRNRDQIHEWFAGVLRSTGTRMTYQAALLPAPLATCLTLTCHPRNVEHVLKLRFDNYPKGPYWQSAFADLMGHGIFNSDGEHWIVQRKTAALEFTTRSLRFMMLESMREMISHRLCPILHAAASSSSFIDLHDVLLRFTFDNICHVAFGVNPASLALGLPHHPFATAFDLCTEVSAIRFMIPPFVWRIRRALRLGMERHLPKSLADVHDFLQDIIIERRKAPENGGHDLLSRFMDKNDPSTGKPFSDKVLRDICLNFILAGRDTSSVALAWFFWLVARHPNVEAKLVQEIEEVIDSAETNDRNAALGYKELEKLTYMKAALHETLRLYPSVPLDFKYVVNDDILPDGSKVKAGSAFAYSIYAMGRMKLIWGPTCREFRPERWIDEDGNFVAPSDPYKFMAFNGGPRVCLGKEMAFLQMKSVAAAILRRWTIELTPEHKERQPAQKLTIALFMKNGLPVLLHPRHSS